jgi:hypothetical protein
LRKFRRLGRGSASGAAKSAAEVALVHLDLLES